MNCTEFEDFLTDYVDDTLTPSVRSGLETHAAECPECRELLNDVSGVVLLLSRVDEVEPPPELITRIAFQTPIGRLREPHELPGFWSRLATKWLQPVLQPRLAMGMAMTILSFAMLEKCTGVRVQHIQAADLSPVRIWDGVEGKGLRIKDRAVKYYENIRLVYEIETRLREVDEQQTAARPESERPNRTDEGPSLLPKSGSSHSAPEDGKPGDQTK